MTPANSIYDVAIIGAGPSGSSAAWHLAQAGLKVIVLEKELWPRDKVCGGGLVARAANELPPGINVPIQHQCHQARVNISDVALSYTAVRNEPIVSMVMRSALDAALVEAATSIGVEFRDRSPVTSVHTDGPLVTVESSTGQLKAQTVIAADGVSSSIATLLGFKKQSILAPAIEWEIPMGREGMSRFNNVALFDFGVIRDGYAWIFPKNSHLSVGLGTMRAQSNNLPRLLTEYLKSKGLPAEQTISRKGNLIPLSPRQGMLAQGRVMLVGDAAGLVDPVTAEGMTFALQSGRLAAEAIIEGGMDPARVPYLYQERLQHSLLPELQYGRWLATLLYRMPGLRNRFFERHGQRLTERMADLIMGKLSYREVLSHQPFWLRMLGLK